MDKISTNTFSGLTQDFSKSKFKSDKYYDGYNIRIITQDGLSTGSIENTKGTKLDFILPDIPQTIYEQNGEEGPITVPAAIKPKILGGCTINNKVIIFSHSDSGADQIWMFEYNEATDSIIGILPNNELNIATHLKYNRVLNFSMNNRIKAIAREETSKYLRVYWVDGGLNNLRSINLYNTNTLNIPQRTLDLQPKVNFENVIVNSIKDGGQLPNGRIAYFYRLINKDGNFTVYSPLSPLVDLNNGNVDSDKFNYPEVFDADELDLNLNQELKERIEFSSEKQVEISVRNGDLDYEFIQFGYCIWQNKDVPEVYLFPEQPFINGFATLNHDGRGQGEFNITLDEIVNIYNIFKNPNTIIFKNNVLYAANLNTELFDVDFDARAYRYKSNGTTYVNFPVPLDADCVNPFNDENPLTNPDWSTNDQFKYQSNGTVLGGSGPNVSYEFNTNSLLADEITDINKNYRDIFNAAPFFNSKVTTDLTSPIKSYINATFMRGEVYRFGITLYSKDGRPSLVKWIGDIKIPYYDDVESGKDFNLFDFDPSTNQLKVNSLYITFNVNIPTSLLSEISGYSICMVERLDSDMTRLGLGITGGLTKKHGIKWTFVEFLEVLQTIFKKFLKTIFDFANPVLDFVGETIIDQLFKTANSIASAFSTQQQQLFNQGFLDEESLKIFIKNILNTVGSGGGFFGGGFVKLFTGGIVDQLAEYITEIVKDFIKFDVAGINEIVYHLEGSAFNKVVGKDTTLYNETIYTIHPTHQFDKYKYQTGDYIRPVYLYGYENSPPDTKIVNVFHRNVSTGLLNSTNSTAAVRKWYKSNSLPEDVFKIGIEQETTLNRGEIINAKNFQLQEGVISNSFIGYIERYSDDGNYLINPNDNPSNERFEWGENTIGIEKSSYKLSTFGIGDKKHLLRLNFNKNVVSNLLINVKNDGYVLFDQQSFVSPFESGISKQVFLGRIGGMFPHNQTVGSDTYTNHALCYGDNHLTGPNSEISFNLLNSGYGYIPANTVLSLGILQRDKVHRGILSYPRSIDMSGDALVSYERYILNQYGGNTYTARSLNNYIELKFVPISLIGEDGSSTLTVQGDSFVGLYGAVNYNYYFEVEPGYQPAVGTKKGLIEIFPCEAPFNFNVREGRHANNSQSTDDLNTTERKIKRKVRRLKRQARKTGQSLEELLKNNTTTNPRRFLFDDFVYYDYYNQLNNLKIFKSKPLIDIFVNSISNRIVKSETKFDGELLDKWRVFKPNDYLDVEGNYGPITELTNFKDRLVFYQPNAFGVAMTNEQSAVQTDRGETLELASGRPLAHYNYISTETGCMHRFGVVTTDSNLFHIDTLRKKIFKFGEGLEPISDTKGISGRLRLLLDGLVNTNDRTLANIGIGVHGVYYPEHNSVFFTILNVESQLESTGKRLLENDYYRLLETGDFRLLENATEFDGQPVMRKTSTISYNLLLNEFESFHSFKPGMYIKTPNRVLCENTDNKHEGYQIYKGIRGNIFGTYYPSYVTVLNNEFPNSVKVYNNLLFYSELYDNNNVNLFNETITNFNCWNDYQSTDNVLLVPNQNIKRYERKWRLQIPRDTNNSGFSTLSKPRMRDTHLFIKLSYDNFDNKKLILHDINTFFQESIT
jgi:hypothetical protein